MGSMLRVSGNGIFQALVGMASWIGLVRILSTFGSAALAGYTIAIRIIISRCFRRGALERAPRSWAEPGREEARSRGALRQMAGLYNMAFLAS
jgi:hypothetical protein